MPTQGVYGQAPAAAGGIPSVIMLTPHPQDDDPEAADPSITIDQFGLVFSPTRIVTRPGSSVIFTNSEAAVAHRINASSKILRGSSQARQTLRPCRYQLPLEALKRSVRTFHCRCRGLI